MVVFGRADGKTAWHQQIAGINYRLSRLQWLGQSLFSGANFGGLSGVVYALMGYVWLTGERAPERGISPPRGLMAFSVLWLIAGYFDILGLSIANAAHVSGLIIGLLMAFWDTRNSARTVQ